MRWRRDDDVSNINMQSAVELRVVDPGGVGYLRYTTCRKNISFSLRWGIPRLGLCSNSTLYYEKRREKLVVETPHPSQLVLRPSLYWLDYGGAVVWSRNDHTSTVRKLVQFFAEDCSLPFAV